MPDLAFDLETVPTLAALAQPYPEETREPPASYSKPGSIALWREKDVETWETARIKEYSLSPLSGRIVAAGRATSAGSDALVAPTEGEEAALIGRLWNAIDTADRAVTWNGVGFDFPFLLMRSALLGVPLPPALDAREYTRRYSTVRHYDVKAMVCQWDATKMRDHSGRWTLDAWAKAFALGGKVAAGSAVYGMHQAGEHNAIGAYAASDANLTFQLYERLNGYLP